jgi:hypothetical protein
MPTATGLPRAGEVWTRTWRLPPDWQTHVIEFEVIERGRGDYWSMQVRIIKLDGEAPDSVHTRPQLWVDCAYWLAKGEIKYAGRSMRGS